MGFWLVFGLVVHPLFDPLPGLTRFVCLAKESQQRKARPRCERLLEFLSQRGEARDAELRAPSAE
jgi:hypothetical protein